MKHSFIKIAMAIHAVFAHVSTSVIIHNRRPPGVLMQCHNGSIIMQSMHSLPSSKARSKSNMLIQDMRPIMVQFHYRNHKQTERQIKLRSYRVRKSRSLITAVSAVLTRRPSMAQCSSQYKCSDAGSLKESLLMIGTLH